MRTIFLGFFILISGLVSAQVNSIDAISEKVTKDVLNIPDTYTRVCITPIGIPYEWPQIPPKKKLEEFIIWDKFQVL